jgi:hypothetical protein
MAIFAVSFLPQLAAGKSAARDDKRRSGAGMEVSMKAPDSQQLRDLR